MKFKILLFTFFMCGFHTYTFGQTNPNFYLHENGVTCMCPNAAVGEVGTVKGIVYTKRTKVQITYKNASTTCTSGITDMNGLFYNYRDFNGNISSWDTSSVTNMEDMFNYALSFNQPIGNWDVGNVTNMRSMFLFAESFNQPIGEWNVSNVINMEAMFIGAKLFNQPIGNWDVSNVANMSHMISTGSFNQPIGNWNVSKVTNMAYMFSGATVFNQSIANWNVSKVTNMSRMFSGATVFNQPIGNWNVSSVVNMSDMFSNARSFNKPIGNWNVSKVINMNALFWGSISFNQDLSKWCVKNIAVKPTDFSTYSKLIPAYQPKWGADCATLSNEDFTQLSNEINVYPNPFVNDIKVSVPENVQIQQIQIVNGLGQTVYTSLLPELNLANLPVGMYYIQVKTNQGNVTEKIIKN